VARGRSGTLRVGFTENVSWHGVVPFALIAVARNGPGVEILENRGSRKLSDEGGLVRKAGPARDVLMVGVMPDPHPAEGEVRIRIAASGINPGKKRRDSFGYGMPYPRVIPHSDGAGQVDQIGEDVSSEWIGRSVWCYGAQSYRPFGTVAEWTVVPVNQVAPLPENVSMDQGACLGIPGITARRAVHIAGAVNGRTVLVQAAAGSVGLCAVRLARQASAQVIGTERSSSDEATDREAARTRWFSAIRSSLRECAAWLQMGLITSSKWRLGPTLRTKSNC
jgi:D-arabinose 1-dehydrogenase-like Zn-dependent alcohol dehydrogenase